MNNRSRMTYLLPLLFLTTSGCSHFAKIPTCRPASAQIEGVETVAVLPFQGEWGTRVAEEVSDAFSQSGTYTIVGASTLPAIQSASLTEDAPAFDQLLVAARQADIDAVLTGSIVSEESESAPRESRLPWSFTKKSDFASSSMTVEYRLIDTRTGETLTQNRIICLEPESLIEAEQSSESLIQRCGLEVASQLTPQFEDCSMALASCRWTVRGGHSVRKGARAAETGDWETASQCWKDALRVNPENDAAIFNLALAAASQGDFSQAEELALEAIRIQHSDCYEAGLEKIRQQRSQAEIVSQPHGDSKLSVAD